jgi:glyceraldehyde 3-phosphate dehydrogenase
MTKIAINGLGRIGRCVLRAVFEEGYNDIEIVAVNGPAATDVHAHLLQYDSVHGRFRGEIAAEGDTLIVNGKRIPVLHARDPKTIRWDQYCADIVMECTGAFATKDAASVHLAQSAKRVMISAPAGDDCPTFVLGVNDAGMKASDTVFSIGSCTTNCLAPVAKLLHEAFGIEHGFMTTIHAYTSDQNIHDGSHKDLRRARAAGLSMVPTKTGAAKAIGLVMPELAGKLSGTSIRVPVPNVSLVDLTVVTQKPVTKEMVNAAFIEAAKGPMKGILKTDDKPLVSTDYNHDNASAIVDLTGTSVVGNNFLRVAAWYDNEWGFSCRMLDMARKMA